MLLDKHDKQPPIQKLDNFALSDTMLGQRPVLVLVAVLFASVGIFFNSLLQISVAETKNIVTCGGRTIEIMDRNNRLWTVAITPKAVGWTCPEITNWEELILQLKTEINLIAGSDWTGSCFIYYDRDWFAEVRFTKKFYRKDGTKTMNPAEIWGCPCGGADLLRVRREGEMQEYGLAGWAWILELKKTRERYLHREITNA